MSLSSDIDPILRSITLLDIKEASLTEYKSKQARSASTSSTIKSKKRRTSAQEKAATTAAEGMNSLASSMIAPQLTRFDQCMEILAEMESNEEITDLELFRISRAIMKETDNYAALFVGLPAKSRLR